MVALHALYESVKSADEAPAPIPAVFVAYKEYADRRLAKNPGVLHAAARRPRNLPAVAGGALRDSGARSPSHDDRGARRPAFAAARPGTRRRALGRVHPHREATSISPLPAILRPSETPCTPSCASGAAHALEGAGLTACKRIAIVQECFGGGRNFERKMTVNTQVFERFLR